MDSHNSSPSSRRTTRGQPSTISDAYIRAAKRQKHYGLTPLSTIKEDVVGSQISAFDAETHQFSPVTVASPIHEVQEDALLDSSVPLETGQRTANPNIPLCPQLAQCPIHGPSQNGNKEDGDEDEDVLEDENEDSGENMGMDIEDIDEPVVQPKYVGPAKYVPTGKTDEERVKLVAQATAATRMPRALWNSLQNMPGQSFAAEAFPSDYILGKKLSEEAQLDVRYVDCCCNGCRAFTRSYDKDTSCFTCKELRYHPNFENRETCKRLRYPQVRTVEPDKYQDIWEGDHIKELRKRSVRWAGKRVEGGGKYFDDNTQIALGPATDGLPCWKRSRLDCWPIIVTNYSLPPEIRTKREYQICCGLIPGTREEITARKVDMDSFLWPLMKDLEILAGIGFPAQRWIGDKQQAFNLRAHLIVVSGDMPAISKLMSFKGIGSKLACRWCTMPAVRAGVPGSEYGKYYMTTKSAASTTRMNYAELPVRTKAGILKDIDEIRGCSAKTSMEAMQTEKGINDQSVFALIGSIDFPWSFSGDIMHILFENIMKELLGLWEGNYKASMVTGAVNGRLSAAAGENYVISKVDWDAMDGEVASSNATVPAQMARRLGSLSKRGYWTAETYSYFLLHLGPIVLKERLAAPYYKHYIKLSKLSNLLAQLEITKEQMTSIRVGLVDWVKDFEKLYYKYQDKYISFCTNPIHALLHLPDCIQRLGPPCHYWCFSMERFGGWVKRQVVHNRKNPIEALNNRVRREEEIHQVISLIEKPETIKKWRDTVTSYRDIWSDTGSAIATEGTAAHLGILFEREPRDYKISEKVGTAVASFLGGWEGMPEGRPGARQTAPQYTHQDISASGTGLSSWRGFRSSGERGFQCWRTKRSKKELERRDSSWVHYEMYENLTAHTGRRRATGRGRRVGADAGDTAGRDGLEKKQRFGEISEFLSFTWKGEEIWVAVIQGWSTTNWAQGYEEGEGPQQLIAAREDIHAVEVSALAVIAGRIMRGRGSDLKHIVFDVAAGTLAAEMF